MGGLLIARQGKIRLEHYRHGRTAQMRFQSMSMAKSVTSLLLGICLDRGLLASLDVEAQQYLPELQGTMHGAVTLRNLINMSSGVTTLHAECNATIYPAFLSKELDIASLVAGWPRGQVEQGKQWNYNELCPLTIGMVIRRVTGKSMSEFAEEALWQPMGAESDATWLTDSKGAEFNCIGVGARLRDWARLGQLVAQRGVINGRRLVSESWIREITSWGPKDQQALFCKGRHLNRSMHEPFTWAGYKALNWHVKPDGTQLRFNGAFGQNVLVDLPSQTVLVQTCVRDELDTSWDPELMAIFQAAINLGGFDRSYVP